jgi:hypothetical protein
MVIAKGNPQKIRKEIKNMATIYRITPNGTKEVDDTTIAIRKLIAGGYTPEKIYQYALEEVAAANKKKAEEEARLKKEQEHKTFRKKKIKSLRNLLERDFKRYIDFLAEDEVDEAVYAAFAEALDDLEATTEKVKELEGITCSCGNHCTCDK